nr:endoribonuclease Dicer-like isoform X1 [Procambarus clarkii]
MSDDQSLQQVLAMSLEAETMRQTGGGNTGSFVGSAIVGSGSAGNAGKGMGSHNSSSSTEIPDITLMTEEEQIKYAMQMSLEEYACSIIDVVYSHDIPQISGAIDGLRKMRDASEFAARSYQLELLQHAKKQNCILVLGTGSGKTFISILLIKELAEQIRGPLIKGNKRTVFVVNTVPLVHQQAFAIENHTGLSVGKYEGSTGVDYWTDASWLEELAKKEVLVVIAQIFLDLILHARLPLSSVNLLIMDECHHATGKHPMREIMRQYETLKKINPQECPRILGLTACVIHRKCKKKNVLGMMKELEATMDCALVTTTNQAEVNKYSTSPKEKIICYESDESSEYKDIIFAQLQGIIEDVKELVDIEVRYRKLVNKKIENIKYIMCTLGDWCVARAIKYEMNHFDDIEKMDDVPAVRDLMSLLSRRLEQIYNFCIKAESAMNPLSHVTKKVKKLFSIFRACNREVYGLIFVERRNTAKILYDLLLEAAKMSNDLAFVKPLYVVGSNTRLGADIRLAQLELSKQKESLSKFRNGSCNFIVSTSVLEEGVDIRKCNVVIRFDKPVNYRAYIQSKGRARAHPSRYLLMVEEKELKDLLETLEVYREIDISLSKFCRNRQLPTDEKTSRIFSLDEHIVPYEPYGPSGPKVTLNSAMPLINVYCGTLPQDKFTVLTPEVSYKYTDDGFVAEIQLPINSCLKSKISGDCMENKDLAKKSAALYLCKMLHAMGELDEFLRPTEVLDDSILDGLVEVPLEGVKEGEPEPGTKKRRQVYDKEVCEAFTHFHEGNYKLYSIIIQPKGTPHTNLVIDSSKSDVTMGLICKKELIRCPFPLYFSKWGEVEVKVKFVKELVEQSSELMSKIEHFHKLVFETLLHINTSLFVFDSKSSGVFIVPIGKTGTIDLDVLNQIFPLTSLRLPNMFRTQTGSFQFERSTFEDAVIYPVYIQNTDLFYVTKIFNDINPQIAFPDPKQSYASYEQYVLKKFGKRTTNLQQPLIAAKHLPRELNYLKKLPDTCKKSDQKTGREPARYIPEHCVVLPLKASLWWQIMCIPSILHRLNSLNLAHQLNVTMNAPNYHTQDSEYPEINFNWTEEIIARIRDHEQNLSALLVKRKSDYIHPFVIVQALTLCAAHDNMDLERLEVLGDTFLKFITAEYLYLKETEHHEGRLSLRRGKLVCNRTLYSLAKSRKIPQKIQSINLTPPANGFLPGFLVKPEVNKILRTLNLSHDAWSSLPDFGLDNLQKIVKKMKQEKRKKEKMCYNPWTEHVLSDKSIADSVEALIGAYLLVGGSESAINFLHMLGIGVYNNESLLKSPLEIISPLLSEESWAKTEIRRLYYTACLDRLEEAINYRFDDQAFIVQAVTHSSYSPNKVTDCNQRLEFLGDAVLDYLVTGQVFSRHASYSPGKISDLRSYYVKNETLARVAVDMKLHKHLLYLAPKLEASIDNFLKICEHSYEEDTLNTEADEVDGEDVDVPKALGDLVEAIIGAVYLDSGRSLEKTWKVVELLIGVRVEESFINIPVNCVRELYERAPGKVKFEKVPRHKNDDVAKYNVQILGLPILCGQGKNYRTARIAAAKLGLQRLQSLQDQ